MSSAWWLDNASQTWRSVSWQTLQTALRSASVGQFIAYGAPTPVVYYVTSTGGALQPAPAYIQQSVVGSAGGGITPPTSTPASAAAAYYQQQQQQVVGVDVTGDGIADYTAVATTGGGVPLVRECHMKLTNAPGGWHCQQLAPTQCCYQQCRANALDGICRGYHVRMVPSTSSACPVSVPAAVPAVTPQ